MAEHLKIQAAAEAGARRGRQAIEDGFDAARRGAGRRAAEAEDADEVALAAWPEEADEAVAPAVLGVLLAGAALGGRTAANFARASGPDFRRAANVLPASGQSATAAAWARARGADLVVEIGAETRKAIRQIVASRLEAGQHVAAAARDIEAIVGIRSDQGRTLLRRQRELAAAGVPEQAARGQLGRMATAMRRQRAETIARTETFAAVARGRDALWEEAVDRGIVEADSVERVWIATLDERVDDICAALDGRRAALDGDFPDGIEPPAHANCRCTLGYVLPLR